MDAVILPEFWRVLLEYSERHQQQPLSENQAMRKLLDIRQQMRTRPGSFRSCNAAGNGFLNRAFTARLARKLRLFRPRRQRPFHSTQEPDCVCFAVLARAFAVVLAVSAFSSSEVNAFPELNELSAVRSALQLDDNREKALSDTERGSEREPLVLPVLRYDVLNLSEGDSRTNVEKWLRIPGLDAVIHRSSMGTDGIDKAYKSRAAAAVGADYKWGAYHFLRQNGSGQEQGTWFIKTLVKSSDHPQAVLLVIDAEYLRGTNSPHPTLSQIVDCIKKIRELTGKYPGIYTGQDFLWEQFNKARYDPETRNLFQNDTWLWVARYSGSYNKLTFPMVTLPPWDKWTLWQISDDRNPTPMFEGMNAEMNIFKGERSDLESFWDENAWDYKLKAPLD